MIFIFFRQKFQQIEGHWNFDFFFKKSGKLKGHKILNFFRQIEGISALIYF